MPSLALSFPDTIRHGYNSCSACHVSITGGGILTPYGRTLSSEVMSTWGTEAEAGVLHGLLSTSDALDIGGDISYLSVASRSYERNFWMQRELSFAVNYERKFYLVARGGLYGENERTEARQSYIQGLITDAISIRIGRFFPAFGLMSNEHSYLYRARFFNQGRETYNAEVVYREKDFEIAASKVFGHPDDFSNGYLEGKEGYTARATYFPSKFSSIGLSYAAFYDQYYNTEIASAVHGQYAFSSLLWLEAQASATETYARLGVEPYKGFTVKPTIEWEYEKRLPRSELVMQWLPRPHFDAQITCSKTDWVLLLHYYL